jgi:uncharacterized protein (DUF1810 family)
MTTPDVERFLKAQENGNYEIALHEIESGRKRSHWIWYIFPQMQELGRSRMSRYYGISSLSEAKLYLANEVLGPRLREITQALLSLPTDSAVDVLGGIDAVKVRSCMTLFDLVAPDDIFERVLDRFYDGKRCEQTLQLVSLFTRPDAAEAQS